MKLSDAILLGSIVGEQPTNHSWNTCLLGIACHAVGKTNFNNREALTRWPWMEEWATPPTIARFTDTPHQYRTILTALCDGVMFGGVTITQVIDYVRSVEPPESNQQQPCDGEGTREELTSSTAS